VPVRSTEKAVHALANGGVDELARTYASTDLRGARSARLLGRALGCSQISQAAERCRCSETFRLHCGLGTYGRLPKTRLPVFCVRGATPPDTGRSLAFAKCRALLPGLVPAVQYDHFTGAPSATEVSEVEAGQGTRRLRSESSARPASAAVPSATDPSGSGVISISFRIQNVADFSGEAGRCKGFLQNVYPGAQPSLANYCVVCVSRDKQHPYIRSRGTNPVGQLLAAHSRHYHVGDENFNPRASGYGY
jgi:hypothetical protein